MPPDASPVEVYLEAGQARTFAVALAWPGWCRSGRDETSALQSLIDYGPRYARALEGTQLEFRAPSARYRRAMLKISGCFGCSRAPRGP